MEETSPHLDPDTEYRYARIGALIPAYNEERFIGDVVRRTLAQVAEVVVVDDGSPDDTAAAARAAGAEVVSYGQNQGKGMAIQTGLRAMLKKGVEYVILLDADGQHLPEEIPRFLEAVTREGSKLLVGNRMHDTRTMPLVRRWTNRFMSWQISLLCGQPVADTQCGFRMIHRDLLPRLLAGERAGRFDYETEMIILSSWRGERTSAVPISTVYGEETSHISPVKDGWRFLKLMGRYWNKKFRKKSKYSRARGED